jgi:hypothetical protein
MRPSLSFAARDFGPTIIGVLVAAQAALWVVTRPVGEPAEAYLGQMIGAESVLLLTGRDCRGLSVFMCGPESMLRSSGRNAHRRRTGPADPSRVLRLALTATWADRLQEARAAPGSNPPALAAFAGTGRRGSCPVFAEAGYIGVEKAGSGAGAAGSALWLSSK